MRQDGGIIWSTPTKDSLLSQFPAYLPSVIFCMVYALGKLKMKNNQFLFGLRKIKIKIWLLSLNWRVREREQYRYKIQDILFPNHGPHKGIITIISSFIVNSYHCKLIPKSTRTTVNSYQHPNYIGWNLVCIYIYFFLFNILPIIIIWIMKKATLFYCSLQIIMFITIHQNIKHHNNHVYKYTSKH